MYIYIYIYIYISEPESEYNSATGVRTRLLRGCSPALLASRNGHPSYIYIYIYIYGSLNRADTSFLPIFIVDPFNFSMNRLTTGRN